MSALFCAGSRQKPVKCIRLNFGNAERLKPLRRRCAIRCKADSPLAAKNHSDLPPAFIISAEFDPFSDDGRNYADKLSASGVPVKFRLYPGAIHGFAWMSGILDQSKVLLDEIGSEVKSALG
jgi:acetyl esterase/lipase